MKKSKNLALSSPSFRPAKGGRIGPKNLGVI